MKTLVFFGSARQDGYTKLLLDAFLEAKKGEVEIIDAYRTDNISPCKDCRYCWHKRGCSIKDGMQEIYNKIDEATYIVLAAPMYFHCIPGPMKTLVDRLQVYWAGVLRKDRPERTIKKGAIIMCGGAPEFENQFKAGEIVLKGLLGDLSTECTGVVAMPDTDRIDPEILEGFKQKARELGQKMYNS